MQSPRGTNTATTMFYSTEILTNKKGGFGIVWYGPSSQHTHTLLVVSCKVSTHTECRCVGLRRLAATLGARSHTRRITRREYASVNIPQTWCGRGYSCMSEGGARGG
jgi:hypothetical protein